MTYVNSIKLSTNNLMLKLDEWYHDMEATVGPSNATNKTVIWCSDNPSVASVNEVSGHIKANGIGTTTIYACSTDGSCECDCCTVTVVNSVPVSKITLTEDHTMQVGTQEKLIATVSPPNATNKSIIWCSSHENILKVVDGTVCALAVGTATITARSADNHSIEAYCNIHVTNSKLVQSICVDPCELCMTSGETAYLHANVCPSDAANTTVTWCSENSKVATVNTNSGLVTAQGTGKTVIYATATDGSGVQGCCTVTVNGAIPVETVIIHAEKQAIKVGEKLTLCAEVLPENATTKSVRWECNNARVASVGATTGIVTANGAGKTNIYATSTDGNQVIGRFILTVEANITDPVEEKVTSPAKETTVADPVDVSTGAHLLKNNLLALFGGQGLRLTAHYSSIDLCNGSMGIGWYHDFEKRLENVSGEIYVYSSPSAFAKYTSADGVTYTSATAGKTGYVLTIDNTQQLPYCINCNSDHYEYYNSDGYLAKIVNHQGFETNIAYTATLVTITDAVTGKSIYIEKNTDGKIVRVYDETNRQTSLTYTNNCLTSICDVNGNTLSYTYDEVGRVQTGTDALGQQYFYNEYDECGRVVLQVDGVDSPPTYFSYGDDGTRTTTNRNYDASTRVFNYNGMLTSFTDENGNTKTYAYDNNFNITCETDALGYSVRKVYNSFNKPTEIIDKNGNKTVLSYDSLGNLIKISYPAVNGVTPEESFSYNGRNQLVQHTDLRGTLTVYTYDSNGMPASKKVGSKPAVQYVYENGLLKSETDARGYTTTYGYNELGQMITKTNADNKTTGYEYDLAGNVLKVTDALGKSITTVYDGNYQKHSVTDANGNKTEYAYNANMKNTSVTFPDNNVITYSYDPEDRLKEITDQTRYNKTIFNYDKAGRILSKEFADGGTLKYEYDKVGNVIKETNQLGGITTKTYDAAGNVLTVTDNDGNLTRYQYDALSRVIRKVNAASGTTVYEYSVSGDLLSETDSLGNKKTYTYDAYGNKTAAADAAGHSTVYTYDANNNLLSVTDPLSHTTTYTYDSLNQLVRVMDAKDSVITYAYDALGRRVTVTDAKNNVFTNVYDGNGNVLKVIDAKGVTVTETTYNSLNLPATVTEASGNRTVYTYNELGKVSNTTNSLGITKEYLYDSLGYNMVIIHPDGPGHAFRDSLGNITNLSVYGEAETHYTYDKMGRMISQSTPSGGTVKYGYNELSVKNEITNARGQVRKCFYDALGRITGYVGAEDSVSYTYDKCGNVLTVTDKNGTVKRTYDALHRVLTCTDTYGKTIRYAYDAVGNLDKITYPDNTVVNYAHDDNNNLTSVTDWAGRTTTYSYDQNNRLIGVVKPDGSVTETSYDNAGRVTGTIETKGDSILISQFCYEYDTIGRITCETDVAKERKLWYTYDRQSRVTKVTVTDMGDAVIDEQTFEYDWLTNITSTNSCDCNQCFQYDGNNRLITYNGYPISYDMDGNMLNTVVNERNIALAFDSANRLIKADGTEYTYTAEDVRIKAVTGDKVTTYTYNTNCRLSQLLTKTTNGVVTKYVYGLGLIGEETDNSFKTYHFDYRGSTTAITDENGNITDTFKYDAYGNVIEHTGISDTPFLFNGQDGVMTEQSGLIYMRARYYNPEIKRFINADIIAGTIDNLPSLNRYAYAEGNPVSNVDPTGLSADDKGVVSNEQYINDVKSDNNIPNIEIIMAIIALLSSGNIFTSLATYYVTKYIKEQFIKNPIKYDVPIYAQGNTNLCWAYCQLMAEDYDLGIERTKTEADAAAKEISVNKHGEIDWNVAGYPDNMFKIGTSPLAIYTALKYTGPLYAFYEGQNDEEDSGHYIVVTGIDLEKEVVYTNNPWGYSGSQTFDEFQDTFLRGNNSSWELKEIYLGY